MEPALAGLVVEEGSGALAGVAAGFDGSPFRGLDDNSVMAYETSLIPNGRTGYDINSYRYLYPYQYAEST